MPLEPDTDLPWTAYLYVTGELSSTEEAAFELRLADDQAAREAVAEAVELAGALVSVETRAWARTRDRGRPARRALAWSGLAAAASLMIAGLWSLRPSPVIEPDASEVAIAWSGLRRTEAIGAEVDFTTPVDLDVPVDPTLPSWLLTAAEPRDDSPREEN